MTTMPRIFCITLRETPKRKEEAKKYFDEVGLNAEFIDGIHGESFGIKSTIPNFNMLAGGLENFITPGNVGSTLSHVMVWNILQHQPEEEFLIVEDDIILCENFFDKFAMFRCELPLDWDFAHVGYLPNHQTTTDDIPVTANVIINQPLGTHAYLVKKRALKVMIETNSLAWNPLGMQIIERSFAKLKHYAPTTSLVSHRSAASAIDEWRSLRHDCDIKPDGLTIGKAAKMRIAGGWHLLEKDAGEYMIWSNGRGEFLFEPRWETMTVEFIAEGGIAKTIRVICPNQPDQEIEIPTYGRQKCTFSVSGADSAVLVSDTFRPIDVFKSSDTRRLGLRVLNGVVMQDARGNTEEVSLYSMSPNNGDGKVQEFEGSSFITPHGSQSDGKINVRGQGVFDAHRSGWKYVMNLLTDYHRDDAPIMDGWVEQTFAYDKDHLARLRIIPYREPWVGFFHNPPNAPAFFAPIGNPCGVLYTREFQDSLHMCKGIYSLSEYTATFLRCFLKNVPVEVLYHPTEFPDLRFSHEKFIQNNNKQVVNFGWWCRRLSSIYQLEVDRSVYQKIRLVPNESSAPSHLLQNIMEIEAGFAGQPLSQEALDSVLNMPRLTDDEYDQLLSRNVAFLDLYDASANNAIVECMARGTPVLVNPLPAVVEYLGADYPFYFNTLAEASEKLKSFPLIQATHEYLVKSGVAEKVKADFFLKTLHNGDIWKSL
jgi:GR25 family glycosyltransferase involved in LPS biosynthesis